jgi:hypothetical protein
MGEAKVTFRVIWDEVALLELDRIWLAANDQEWIENLAIRINTELTHNPLQAGESRAENNRVLFKYPLVVWFQVTERLREVRVLQVRLAKPVL